MRIKTIWESETVEVNRRLVPFSYWPTKKSGSRSTVQSRIFASNPFNIMDDAVGRISESSRRVEAKAYLQQAREFYAASEIGSTDNTKPLLLYYSFMNVVKALILQRDAFNTLADTHHGLTLRFNTVDADPANAQLGAKISTGTGSNIKVNLYDELLKVLDPTTVKNRDYEIYLSDLFPQILLGHRLWRDSTGESERFINVPDIQFRRDKDEGEIWIRMALPRSEYIRLGHSQEKLLSLSSLDTEWERKQSEVKDDNIYIEPLHVAESSRPSEHVDQLVEPLRNVLWQSVTMTKPFRRHYLYLSVGERYPQLCSIYAMFFYLGSLARYRPQKLREYMTGNFGAFFSEFIENQPTQWLYLMASLYAKQEVSKASVV